MSIRVSVAVAILLRLATGSASAQGPGGDRYYLTIFGAQSVPYRVPFTHTWAAFTRTAATPTGEVVVESHAISWMPATLKIRPYALRTEPGVNLTLAESFGFVASFGGRASVWGPFDIDADHFERLKARKERLESGEVRYRAIGAFTRTGPVSNCGQSFSRASPVVGEKYLQPTPAAGENGTSRLAARYLRAGVLTDGGTTHPWLLSIIGADAYPVTPRQPGERASYFFR